MLHASETWSVNEEDVMRLEKNNERVVRRVCNVTPEEKFSVWEFRENLYRKSLQESL